MPEALGRSIIYVRRVLCTMALVMIRQRMPLMSGLFCSIFGPFNSWLRNMGLPFSMVLLSNFLPLGRPWERKIFALLLRPCKMKLCEVILG